VRNTLSDAVDNTEADFEDQRETGSSFIQDRTKGILPQQQAEGSVNRGETEKLARFFAQFPAPDQAKSFFFGFLNPQQMYGFSKDIDARIQKVRLQKAIYQYMSSFPEYEYKREHSILFENVNALFSSIIAGSVGTKDNVQNMRTALNELRINRQYGETGQKKKFWQI
jgi:hypothetical protein